MVHRECRLQAQVRFHIGAEPICQWVSMVIAAVAHQTRHISLAYQGRILDEKRAHQKISGTISDALETFFEAQRHL